jgi:hypothetical protein
MGRDAVFGHYLRDGEVKVLSLINQTIDWERSSAYSRFFLERPGKEAALLAPVRPENHTPP